VKLLRRSLFGLCTAAIALAAFPAQASALDAPLTATKQFGASQITVGGTTTLTISVENTNVDTATNLSFVDLLPAGLMVASPAGLTNSCGGSAGAGGGAVSLSGGMLGGSGRTCVVTANVTGTTAGVKNNTVTVTSSNFGASAPASATLTVTPPAPPTLTKAFSPSTLPVGATTRLTFTLTNPNPATALTRVTFADPLPLGLMVAAVPSVSNTCGGAPSVGPFALAVALAAATIPAGTTCTFSVNVTATSPGVKSNTTTIVASTPGGIGSPASASVTVTP
jgi:uncharacterized repeat protein (TIGR01451 family)